MGSNFFRTFSLREKALSLENEKKKSFSFAFCSFIRNFAPEFKFRECPSRGRNPTNLPNLTNNIKSFWTILNDFSPKGDCYQKKCITLRLKLNLGSALAGRNLPNLPNIKRFWTILNDFSAKQTKNKSALSGRNLTNLPNLTNNIKRFWTILNDLNDFSPTGDWE